MQDVGCGKFEAGQVGRKQRWRLFRQSFTMIRGDVLVGLQPVVVAGFGFGQLQPVVVLGFCLGQMQPVAVVGFGFGPMRPVIVGVLVFDLQSMRAIAFALGSQHCACGFFRCELQWLFANEGRVLDMQQVLVIPQDATGLFMQGLV